MVCFGFEVGGSFLLGTAMVIFSAMLYGGVVKMPGDWWNTAPNLCGLMPVQPTNYQNAEKNDEIAPLSAATSPSARVVGNSVEPGEHVDELKSRACNEDFE